MFYKCKMCGGNLSIDDNTKVVTCEYCGTSQTIPDLSDERIANLYDRANYLRRSNEFDKAYSLYEHILSLNDKDAEAYWSLVLCKYGIEYVEDPTTHKRIPTVNRTQYDSIYNDPNYLNALKYADTSQRILYEEEAKQIDNIEKNILNISSKEKPFDIFICYKETDNQGRRTIDSVLAQNIYKELTNEGYKVFFSRITLEDKLGVAYEPYIFAALNSSKVMIVVGTSKENLEAVWVKNEWSRYLSLIQKGQKKTLIPCYKDMNPYDLPEEFAYLQAQDMSKIGFMQDLIHGIKKIIDVDKPKETIKETIVVNNTPTNNTIIDTELLIKRAFIFLRDREFFQASRYFERVLDQDPENARAYLGKLLIELKINNIDEINNVKKPFENSNNYKRALRYADAPLKNKLLGYLKQKQDKNKPKDLKCANVGDYILFGKYEQDDDITNGKEDIEWLVINKIGYKLLVISKYALEAKAFNEILKTDTKHVPLINRLYDKINNGVPKNNTFELCTLRKWLNSVFINNAFTANDQYRILPVKVMADKNPKFNTDPGGNTQDKIFLLSVNEVNKYFSSDKERQCKATDYAATHGINVNNGFCGWWLRTPGHDWDCTTRVERSGHVGIEGCDARIGFVGVRPAMWISVD